MATPPKLGSLLLSTIVTTMIVVSMNAMMGEATWCVARSDASRGALQAQLDYACGNGADCRPIQPGGICFNPNTIQNHASYAFNSFYHRRGSCYFGGTATIAVTDPSFGRCVYPPFASMFSTGGGANTPITKLPMNKPNVPSKE